jgi:hypothetical protein
VRLHIKAIRLLILALLYLPFAVTQALRGVWDWLTELRQVWWRIRANHQLFARYAREAVDPGVHHREMLARRMPNVPPQAPRKTP